MHGVFKARRSRLLATALALALTVAYVISGYAHAAGHQAPHGGVTAVAANHGGDHATGFKPAAPDHGHAHGHAHTGYGTDGSEPAHSPDCCDMICHGGQAILATAAPFIPHPLSAAPVIEPATALHGADAGGLDRPPKPFRSA